MSISPFEYPEVKSIFIQLFDEILQESPRGAVIIGTTIVEDHLTKFIEAILPYSSSKDKKKLLRYPGHLSSFSAKIEMAFAFRLINENLYISLNELRDLRNRAAHNSSTFSLIDFRSSLDKVFNIGPSATCHIRNQALKMLVELKSLSIENIFDEHNLEQVEKESIVNNLLTNKKLLASIERQVPHWELIYGLSLICGLLSSQKVNTLKALGSSKTWGEIVKQTVPNRSV